MRRAFAVVTGVLFMAALLGVVTPGPRAAEAPARRSAKLGVVGFYNPRLMYLKYQPLVDYLTEKTSMNWELVIGSDYDETVKRLCEGKVDLAYLGPLTFTKAKHLCGARAIVRLQTGGKPTFHSYIMVRVDSPYRTLEELRGKRIGLGSPLSTSAHLVPLAMLRDRGVLGEGGKTSCTNYGHHERAARACLMGEVDACGVRDVIGDRFIDRGLRVLARSEPIPNFPLVASPLADEKVVREVIKSLVDEPAADAALRARIATWDPELASGFVQAREADYDAIRDLAFTILGKDVFDKTESELACAPAAP